MCVLCVFRFFFVFACLLVYCVNRSVLRYFECVCLLVRGLMCLSFVCVLCVIVFICLRVGLFAALCLLMFNMVVLVVSLCVLCCVLCVFAVVVCVIVYVV